MKKVIALILAIIMMFSMTSVSYAVDNTVTTQTSSVVATNENSVSKIDNYMDYLEAKLDDRNTNFFVKIIVKLVIIGVMLGIINVKDFDEWFENTAPDTDTDNSGSNPPTDSSTDKDWEDGTELKLYRGQSLPYTKGRVTITEIKITKEHYNGYWVNYAGREVAQKYRYTITIKGNMPVPIEKYHSTIFLQYFSDDNPAGEDRYYPLRNHNQTEYNIDATLTVDEKGNFVYVAYQYNVFEDYDSYYIDDIDVFYDDEY